MPNPKVTAEDMNLESGFADNFDGAIIKVYFAQKEDYTKKSGSVDPMLILTLDSPDFEHPIDQAYSMGSGKQWQAANDGRSVTSGKDANSHRFNASSRAGSLVDRMFTLVGGGDKNKGIQFFVDRGHYMTDSEFYEDLSFHWKREKMRTVGGEDSDVLLPDAYLGEVKATASKGGGKTTETDTTDLDMEVVTLVSGKTDREVKVAALKNEKLKANSAYMKTLISGDKLTTLEADGLISKGPDGKYV